MRNNQLLKDKIKKKLWNQNEKNPKIKKKLIILWPIVFCKGVNKKNAIPSSFFIQNMLPTDHTTEFWSIY
jgi:hypothetical protein